MEGKGFWQNRRGVLLYMLVFLFVALMVIPLIMIFRNIFAFEERAHAIMEAAKIAANFKKDYIFVLYAPVNNITLCHTPPKMEPCPITMRTPQVFNIPPEASNKYAPVVYVKVEDPPLNITVVLDLMAFGKYAGGIQTSLDVIEPRTSTGECWNETIESVNYRYCRFNCTYPVKISKTRHYATGVGQSGGAMIDNISVEQGTGTC